MSLAENHAIGDTPAVVQTSTAPQDPGLNPGAFSNTIPFSSDHLTLLKERGVDRHVAAAAGLLSVDPLHGAQLLGRTDVLESGGLAIPYATSSPAYVRVRMDSGTSRYLAPEGQPVPVYLPSTIDLAGSNELFVVEGPLKALALVSIGLDAVGLGGVTTTLEKGDPPRLNSSWTPVSLIGRNVTIVFDSDRATNTAIARAEARLAIALESAGATVMLAELPPAGPGRGWGPDDFIAANGAPAFGVVVKQAVPANPAGRLQALELSPDGKLRLAALLGDPCFLAAVLARGAQAQAQVKLSPLLKGLKTSFDGALKQFQAQLNAKRATENQAGPSSFASEFEIQDGRICVRTATQQGSSLQAICNFTARIVEEVTRTDGEEKHLLFAIEGQLDTGERLPRILIPPCEFLKGTWPTEHWGASACVAATRDAQRQLGLAIQRLSSPRRVSVQVCTGWVNLGGHWGFAHAGGLVSAGIVAPVDVRLDPDLAAYMLPDEVVDLTRAAEAVEPFYEVVRGEFGLLLLAAVFRAPLFTARPVPGVLYLIGASGSYKTTVALLMQRFFGDFSTPPASWIDTPAALERAAFAAQDCLIVFDDVAPKSGESGDEHRAKASAMIRAIGNEKGRRRMRADMTAQREFPPRALVVATGEDMPHEESIVARCMVVAFAKPAVDLDALTALQDASDRFPTVMRAYLEWLAPRYDAIAYELETLVAGLVPGLASIHPRSGRLAAEILLGLELYLRFATELGLMSNEKAGAWRGRGLEAAKIALGAQGGRQKSTDPVRRFLDVVADLVRVGQLSMGRIVRGVHYSSDRSAVWSDDDEIYLLPTIVFRHVVEAMRHAGEQMPLAQQELHKRLVERGIATPDGDHMTVKRGCAGGARVLVLSRRAVEKLIGADFPRCSGSTAAGVSAGEISPMPPWPRGGLS